MVNESHNRLQTNGNTHLHSVALKSNQSLDHTLVQIDSEPVIGLNGSINQNTVMGQSVPDNQSNNLFSIRKFPMKSILKNGKVHDSTNEKNILFQTRPRSSILKKPIATIETNQLNGSANSESAISSPQVSENQSASLVSAKSPISIVHFRLESAKSTASSSQQQSSDTPTMPSSVSIGAGSDGSSQVSLSTTAAAAAAAAGKTTTTTTTPTDSIQPLSANHLQVPSSHSTLTRSPLVLTTNTIASSSSSATRHIALGTSNSLGSSHSTSGSSLQPSYYTATTTQRMSDLRKILNPEVEKEDSFKKFTETIENCDCFEFNLNNAAKLITVLVLLATLVLVIRALKGDR
ncbi:hypothetical protein BLOT_013280 [Blomia tropicalis]|nr:hypothetical protein BLOT_013280 [Blomia tropicalis]